MSMAVSLGTLLSFLVVGIAFVAVADAALRALASGRPVGHAMIQPIVRAAAALAVQRSTTEAPDAFLWSFAPILYFVLAAIGMSVVPFAVGFSVSDFEAGIVLWGACESLTIIAIFLHGWSPNAPLPLIGAYRYVAIGLPAMLVSMFVLIAVALPAQSLSFDAIVASQTETWNAMRHPLGLPLFLVLGLALTFRGPLDYADPADLAGGTSAEDSAPRRLAWQTARHAMLVSFAAVASAAFLGGPLGPWLPGPVWMALKMAGIVVTVLILDILMARTVPERMLGRLWTVFLPLAFLDLAIAGGLLLW